MTEPAADAGREPDRDDCDFFFFSVRACSWALADTNDGGGPLKLVV
jgi:hypothetical protein